MPLYERVVKPLLFRLDPELVHDVALTCIAKGLVPRVRVGQRWEKELFGVRFPNPVGLAAGFDKDGVAVEHWHRLGFGFVELGTVTRHAQPGNPKPRLFRLPEQGAIVNRMGFNNAGADALAERLSRSKPTLPVGINLGKSKITELKDAPEDYAYSFRRLREFGDYFVVNVSSPNTPGLRSLQDREPLTRILLALREVDPARPLFVKVAPDLEDRQLDEVVEVCMELKLTGIVATNTTVDHSMLPADPRIEGGLSGEPLRTRALRVLRHLKAACGDELLLIGAGGITRAEDLHERLDAGASLVQVYTGFVYGGPGFVKRLLDG